MGQTPKPNLIPEFERAFMIVEIPESLAPTCATCGAGFHRVEHLHDFILTRTRLIFVCGHSRYLEPPGTTPPNAHLRNHNHGTFTCSHCGEPYTARSPKSKKCADCLGGGYRRREKA